MRTWQRLPGRASLQIETTVSERLRPAYFARRIDDPTGIYSRVGRNGVDYLFHGSVKKPKF